MTESNEKLTRDFYARSEEEQKEFLDVTWCNNCMEADLGMIEPEEYELEGRIFIEGKCTKCGSPVITEIVESDDEEQEFDV